MDDLILHQMDRGREFTSLSRYSLVGWLQVDFDGRDYHLAPFPWVLEDIISRALRSFLANEGRSRFFFFFAAEEVLESNRLVLRILAFKDSW